MEPLKFNNKPISLECSEEGTETPYERIPSEKIFGRNRRVL